MKLSQYKDGLEEVLSKFGDLEVGYAIDDEGNNHHKVKNSPSPAQVHDLRVHDLEIVGYWGEKTIAKEDINCVIIN